LSVVGSLSIMKLITILDVIEMMKCIIDPEDDDVDNTKNIKKIIKKLIKEKLFFEFGFSAEFFLYCFSIVPS